MIRVFFGMRRGRVVDGYRTAALSEGAPRAGIARDAVTVRARGCVLRDAGYARDGCVLPDCLHRRTSEIALSAWPIKQPL
jgi:hypothetical protein